MQITKRMANQCLCPNHPTRRSKCTRRGWLDEDTSITSKLPHNSSGIRYDAKNMYTTTNHVYFYWQEFYFDQLLYNCMYKWKQLHYKLENYYFVLYYLFHMEENIYASWNENVLVDPYFVRLNETIMYKSNYIYAKNCWMWLLDKLLVKHYRTDQMEWVILYFAYKATKMHIVFI